MPVVQLGFRHLSVALTCLAGVCLLPSAAHAKTFTLPEFIELAKQRNPGLAASAAATSSIEAQLSEARRSWFPSGELTSLLAPIPEIRCQTTLERPADKTVKEWRELNCQNTNFNEFDLRFNGVFTLTEVRLTQPLFTFGKISAGVAAARAGVAASKSREAGVADEVEFNVKRAYYGAKLARDVLETLNEGISYLNEARDKVDKELAAGTGEVSVTDRYRLQTVRSEVDGRVFEARKGADLARNGLRVLLGPDGPKDFTVDPEPLTAAVVSLKPVETYEDLARQNRPELRAITQLAASKQALADLERRRQYPDLVLIGTARLAYASSVDDPQNAFFNDPFNTQSAGVAAAVRMPLDLFVRNARASKVQAEAQETSYRQREAVAGVGFEVRKAHAELSEALDRAKVAQEGEKAGRRWITAIAQNFSVGLAETKDVTDALGAYFLARIRYLQALHDTNIAAAALSRATGTEIAQQAPAATP
jgi:outer membrane protein TolC